MLLPPSAVFPLFIRCLPILSVFPEASVWGAELGRDRDGKGEDEAAAHRKRGETAGDLHRALQQPPQEGVRAVGAMRRRGRRHRLLRSQQALQVLQRQVPFLLLLLLLLSFFSSTRIRSVLSKLERQTEHCCSFL